MTTNKHTLKEWVMATRPWSFPASTTPVATTIAYLFWCGHEINWAHGIWAIINIVVFHAAGNMWSDYFDYKHKVDDKDTFGAKYLTEGVFTTKEIFYYALTMLLVALSGGLALTWRTGWELLLIGAGGALCTLLYPVLKYRAMGDAVIFVSYALLPALGTSFVTTGIIDLNTLWVIVPSGLITVAILHANNTRDTLTDRRAGIRTLAMNVGNKAAIILYITEVISPYIIVGVFSVIGLLPYWTLSVALSLPLAINNSQRAIRSHQSDNKSISDLDEKSAQLQLAFNTLFVLSLLVATWTAN